MFVVVLSPIAFHPLDFNLIYIPAGLVLLIWPEYKPSLSNTSAVACCRTGPLASRFTVRTSPTDTMFWLSPSSLNQKLSESGLKGVGPSSVSAPVCWKTKLLHIVS